MPLSSSLPFLMSFVDVLRPSKSPHLVASSFGVVCLCLVSDNLLVKGVDRFLCISIAASIALILVVLFSFRDRISYKDRNISEDEAPEELETQFKFARSMGIGSAIFALVLAGILINGRPDLYFYIAWIVAAAQLLTFTVYSAIRLIKEEVESELKIFEVSFIMFVMLLGFIYCLSQLEKSVSSCPPDSSNCNWFSSREPDGRYLFSAAILFLLWLRYEVFWVRRIFQIVEVRVR